MEKPFPLFIDLSGQPVTVVGGGKVGRRRVEALLSFGALVTVIDPEESPWPEGVTLLPRPYRMGDLAGAVLAVAATDDRAVNRQVGLEAKERAVPVSVADCAAECSFFFPAICQGQGLVAGLVSEDGNHKKTARAAAAVRKLLREMEGETHG